MNINKHFKQNDSVLVTGGTGFVGSNLVTKLLSYKIMVHVIARMDSDLSELDTNNELLVVHIFDNKFETMNKIIKKSKPKIIFHLASLFIAEHKSNDIQSIIESNILFGTFLLEAMIKNDIKLLVNTGTSWEHQEDDSFKPVNLYASSKKAFSDIIYYYHDANNLSCITLKLFDTYGQNDKRNKLLSLLKKHALSGERLEMSQGEQLLDLVEINDVVNAFVCAGIKIIEKGEATICKEYAISSGELISLKDLCVLVSEILEKKLNVIHGARPYRKREVMRPWQPLKILPNWKPEKNMYLSIKNFLLEK